MTAERMKAAMCAIELALREIGPGNGVYNAALAYGQRISNRADIRAVLDCIDMEKLKSLLVSA